MTVGTAMVLLQMGDIPIIFGCAEVVANRLCRCTGGAPACAVKTHTEGGVPQYALTEYGQSVKKELEKRICLNAN